MSKSASKPVIRRGHRDPDTIRNVMLRMSDDYVMQLDRLCHINQRSRREIVELLVAEATLELKDNPDYRIDPF